MVSYKLTFGYVLLKSPLSYTCITIRAHGGHFGPFSMFLWLNTYVIKRTFDDASIEKLFHALMDKNLISHINVDIRADPNENYNILSNILTTTLDKCIPCKKVRYNKYKHKNSQWITSGILKSIRFRDRLYQKVKKLHTIQINLEF